MLRGKHRTKHGVVHHLGCHVLRVEGADPPSSEWIQWDGNEIGITVLVSILSFERSPYIQDLLNEQVELGFVPLPPFSD